MSQVVYAHTNLQPEAGFDLDADVNGLIPNAYYKLTIDPLMGDLADASENITDLIIDGVSMKDQLPQGGCNNHGGNDNACSWGCGNGSIVIDDYSPSNTTISVKLKYENVSKDCKCPAVNLDGHNFEIYGECVAEDDPNPTYPEKCNGDVNTCFTDVQAGVRIRVEQLDSWKCQDGWTKLADKCIYQKRPPTDGANGPYKTKQNCLDQSKCPSKSSWVCPGKAHPRDKCIKNTHTPSDGDTGPYFTTEEACAKNCNTGGDCGILNAIAIWITGRDDITFINCKDCGFFDYLQMIFLGKEQSGLVECPKKLGNPNITIIFLLFIWIGVLLY
jgi:hypothetical protein